MLAPIDVDVEVAGPDAQEQAALRLRPRLVH
jgi:hypothetical protein